MPKYAIVGFGCAGFNAMRAIRQIDPDAQIDVYERTDRPPFNPMLSTYFASGRIGNDGIFPFGSMTEINQRYAFHLMSECVVSRVDTKNKKVITTDGQEETYDKILIATGASAFIPGFLKVETRKVFLMRTLDDALALRNYLDEHKIERAAVVGGSMVGIKVAELLHREHVKTDIIDAAGYLFPLAAHEHIAHKIEKRLIDMGIGIQMNKFVERIADDGVHFKDGTMTAADIVCLCVGTRANLQLVANLELVEGEGLNINKGIVIDHHGCTNIEGIYAAGDCCEGTNLQTGQTVIIGLWANAAAQGSCAGKNMAGLKEEYYGNILHNITHFFDMDFVGLGNPMAEGEMYQFQYDDFEVSVVKKDGRIVSMNIYGNYRISGILKTFLIKQIAGENRKLTPIQKGLLKNSGFSTELIELIGG